MNKEKTVVVFNEEIDALDVKNCIRQCIFDKAWPLDSDIIILAGHHTSSDGQLQASFSAFLSNIGKHVEDLKDELKSEIERYSFSYNLIRHQVNSAARCCRALLSAASQNVIFLGKIFLILLFKGYILNFLSVR